VPLDSDPKSARGGVTSQVIVALYQAFLLIIVKPGDIFIEDRASVYTVHIIIQLLYKIRVQVIV
jgi:hypothetical protein